jgi:hypothetical protein
LGPPPALLGPAPAPAAPSPAAAPAAPAAPAAAAAALAAALMAAGERCACSGPGGQVHSTRLCGALAAARARSSALPSPTAR